MMFADAFLLLCRFLSKNNPSHDSDRRHAITATIYREFLDLLSITRNADLKRRRIVDHQSLRITSGSANRLREPAYVSSASHRALNSKCKSVRDRIHVPPRDNEISFIAGYRA